MQDFKMFVGRRVIVVTEPMVFDGTLARAGRDMLVLENVSAVADDGGRTPIDGSAAVPSLSVQWVQVP